jgi:hypothetical protein
MMMIMMKKKSNIVHIHIIDMIHAALKLKGHSL